MSQRLEIYQSMWAMERRHTDGHERTLEKNIEMIARAGFDGISVGYASREGVREIASLLAARNTALKSP